jgi:hypothetical protein
MQYRHIARTAGQLSAWPLVVVPKTYQKSGNEGITSGSEIEAIQHTGSGNESKEEPTVAGTKRMPADYSLASDHTI